MSKATPPSPRPVKTVCFSLDGLRLFSGSNDTTVRFWDVATEACIGTLGGHEVRLLRAS